ncbi:hypothetical protein AAF712_003538 [Marasmius tenuissimus]|uniref:DUF6534 domain-containing protein n=1 Tax=Marasmius tenuissimus TaxID=585030 RepID=A0ABR3A7C7_9AGAR
MSFPKDRKIVKTLVYAVYLLDTTQTVIFFRDAYRIFATGFGDMAALRAAHLSGFSVPILTGLVSILVQIFYCYQIQVISRSWILPGIILAISLTQFVASIIEGVLIFKINNSAILQVMTLVPCTLVKASSSLRGNHIIRRLIRLVIETGSLTATVAIVDAILFVGLRKYPYHMLPSRCLAKLYANTLMVILNSRVRVQGSRDQPKLDQVCTAGWSQSIDVRFARTPTGRSTANGMTNEVDSLAPGEGSRARQPQTIQKVVQLKDVRNSQAEDIGKADDGLEIPKNVYHDSL